MRIKFLFIICLLTITNTSIAQRGLRVGFIDMDYILENVSEYQQATKQLNDKVLKWRKEMEKMQGDIDNLQNELDAERVLLTKELIEEREEEIDILKAELFDYQQQRFGPEGDLILQKNNLVQPLQDQVFTSIQEIGKARKFDMIFDKSSDLMILYADNKLDLSDIVLASINRAEKIEQREQMLNEFEKENDPIQQQREARKKELEEKKKERQAAYEAKRQKLLEARKAAQEKKNQSDENSDDNGNEK